MVIPKAIIVHNSIKFKARAETNVNFLYPERPPFICSKVGFQFWLPDFFSRFYHNSKSMEIDSSHLFIMKNLVCSITCLIIIIIIIIIITS